MEKAQEKQIQDKITKLVELYSSTFFKEYNQFIKQMRETQDAQKGKFSEVEQMDMVTRALFEIPETLYSIFKMKLEEHEFKYLFPEPDANANNMSKNFNKGPRWFAKKFEEFRVPKEI